MTHNRRRVEADPLHPRVDHFRLARDGAVESVMLVREAESQEIRNEDSRCLDQLGSFKTPADFD
jgi:hypothetical protein